MFSQKKVCLRSAQWPNIWQHIVHADYVMKPIIEEVIAKIWNKEPPYDSVLGLVV